MKRDRDLVKTLQAIYDSEINFVIAMCWDGGVDFAFLSQMQMMTLPATGIRLTRSTSWRMLYTPRP